MDNNEEQRVYRFGDEEIEVPVNISIEDVRATWSQLHPAIENAEAFQEEDGSVTFIQRSGSKG